MGTDRVFSNISYLLNVATFFDILKQAYCRFKEDNYIITTKSGEEISQSVIKFQEDHTGQFINPLSTSRE